MKRILSFLIGLLCASHSYSQITLVDSIWVDSMFRSYKLYIPAAYNPTNPTPLVFDFHGYTGNFNIISNFTSIADTANFIVVAPQGDSVHLIGLYYPGWNCFNTVADANKDLSFISNLIDTLASQLNINLDRVYSAGASNGGFMGYDLACFMSNRFAAIASVSGSMIPLHDSSCTPVHPTPIMQIHGTADSTVYYTGNNIPGFTTLNIDTLVKHWVDFNHCSPVPAYNAVLDIIPIDGCHAEHYVYSGGDMGSTVELFKVINGGHTWPGSGFTFTGPATCMDFSASAEIWRFFRKYKLSDLMVTTSTMKNNLGEQLNFTVFPNPGNGLFTIESSEKNVSIEISTMLGNVVYRSNTIERRTTIDLSGYSAGAYFIQMNGKHSKANKKIIISN